mmetsp:Transcript_297/g.644  ORF Transcript_297/g.644 Transcript_297/m.644 type:complete len:114 (-) Transcript_297:1801-2142(-)
MSVHAVVNYVSNRTPRDDGGTWQQEDERMHTSDRLARNSHHPRRGHDIIGCSVIMPTWGKPGTRRNAFSTRALRNHWNVVTGEREFHYQYALADDCSEHPSRRSRRRSGALGS